MSATKDELLVRVGSAARDQLALSPGAADLSDRDLGALYLGEFFALLTDLADIETFLHHCHKMLPAFWPTVQVPDTGDDGTWEQVEPAMAEADVEGVNPEAVFSDE